VDVGGFGGWRVFEAGGLAVGGWRLEVGRLEVGGWRLENDWRRMGEFGG